MIKGIKSTTNTFTYILSAKRTAIGRFLGRYSQVTGPQLAGFAIQGATLSIDLNPKLVDEVIMGCSVSSGMGQSPARQASIHGQLLTTTPCTTINTTSSFAPIILALKSLELQQNRVVVTGGFDSFSKIPFYLSNHRKGFSYGMERLHDGIVTDFLTSFDKTTPLGIYAQITAKQNDIHRQIQDDYAVLSYTRAIHASRSDLFHEEILGLGQQDLQQGKHHDELLNGYFKDALKQIRPIYNHKGTITIGNSAQMGDGAGALVLASQSAIIQNKLSPLARIIGYSTVSVDPKDFCKADVLAISKVLQKYQINLQQIDLFNLGQQFSISSIYTIKQLGLQLQKINVHGGAVALGYCASALGTQLIANLVNALTLNKKKIGLAVVSDGTGGSSAIIVQNLRR